MFIHLYWYKNRNILLTHLQIAVELRNLLHFRFFPEACGGEMLTRKRVFYTLCFVRRMKIKV